MAVSTALTETATALQLLPGLRNQALQVFFVVLAVVVLAWGFERYRSTFSKVELGLSVLIAVGIVTVGVFPGVYGTIAGLLNVESRFLVISLIGNTVFIFLFLYLITLVNGNRTLINDLTRGLTVEQASLRDHHDEPTIYVVIPAYNESDTIDEVLASLPETVHGHRIHPVVVSDGSEDRTRQVAEGDGRTVVEHPLNQGQGGALKTGFEIARQNGADIVVTMDADGQHPASQLPDLVGPIVDDEADYVVGSRYLGENRSGNSVTRESGIRVFTAIINAMSKADITDCTNGYRAIRGSMLGRLTLTEERFSAPELIIESRKKGLRITEVPVTIRERDAGETKKPKLGYAVGLARTIFVTWIR
jgi:hypothetical protein